MKDNVVKFDVNRKRERLGVSRNFVNQQYLEEEVCALVSDFVMFPQCYSARDMVSGVMEVFSRVLNNR